MTTQPVLVIELFNGQVQYTVPRWQRRYRWGKADIERLVEDLKTVAPKPIDTRHYTGTILTKPEPGDDRTVRRLRLVDGQQRLTTISILLATIAEKLGDTGAVGHWTGDIIRNDRVLNAGRPPALRRKLRLQNGDDEEYRNEIEGRGTGPGAVSAAFKICRRIVAREDSKTLMDGIDRMQVVQINLQEHDDPQQIYESLNGTGQRLSEGEKVKNWLLMGLPEEEQQELHDDVWKRTETVLGAHDDPDRLDVFLRDMLAARVGKKFAKERAYEELRRWATRTDQDRDKPALLRAIGREADLYSLITGTGDARRLGETTARTLEHLRTMPIQAVKPLVLRILRDATGAEQEPPVGHIREELTRALEAVSTWITRFWVSDRGTAGLNQAAAGLAAGEGPPKGAKTDEFWTSRIKTLRHNRAGVPSDEEIRTGVQNRKAYGGMATRGTLAVLYALVREEQGEESPPLDRLTVEHVMPQRLNDAWRTDLGTNSDELHGQYRDKLGNLTLSGDRVNPTMGNRPFGAKRPDFARSPLLMNRRIADADAWNEEEIEARTRDLAERILARWKWTDAEAPDKTVRTARTTTYLWRLDDGPERRDTGNSRFTLNVVRALLDAQPDNAEKLAGDALTRDLQRSSDYPPDRDTGTVKLQPVPGHPNWVINAYRNQRNTIEYAKRKAAACGLTLNVEALSPPTAPEKFWRAFDDEGEPLFGAAGRTERMPRETAIRRTGPHNQAGDGILIVVRQDAILLKVEAGPATGDYNAQDRARAFNRRLTAEMSDQNLVESTTDDKSRTAVKATVDLEDEAEWPSNAEWVRGQHERLTAILMTEEDSTRDAPRGEP